MTIRRLELCGAVLATRLHEVFVRETDLKIDKTFFWGDSMTVLDYTRNYTSRYKSFVANKLAVIHDLSDVHHWHHIDKISNPVDLASRGCSADQDEMLKLWLQGPRFFFEADYPRSNGTPHNRLDSDEIEPISAVRTSAVSGDNHFVDSLTLFHQRQKWTRARPDIYIDDIVLLEEENTP